MQTQVVSNRPTSSRCYLCFEVGLPLTSWKHDWPPIVTNIQAQPFSAILNPKSMFKCFPCKCYVAKCRCCYFLNPTYIEIILVTFRWPSDKVPEGTIRLGRNITKQTELGGGETTGSFVLFI